MSSAPPVPPPSTTTTTTTYWCHDCDMSILLSPPPPPCPHCQNPFLQHMDSFPPLSPGPGPGPIPSIWASSNSNPNFLLDRPYLHRLIHHLTNSAQPPTISPPHSRASRAVLDGLKRVQVRGEVCCSICKDQFRGDDDDDEEEEEESVVNELPCGHVYHNACIVPWLEINTTCPLCRFRLECEEEGEGEIGEGAFVGAMRLDELLDDGDDEGSYENEFRELMRIERGGTNMGIGEAGTGPGGANSVVEAVSSWPLWEGEGEREIGTSDVENVVRA